MTTLENLCLEIVDCEHKTAPIDETGSHFAVGTPAMRGNVINFGEARRISEGTFKAWTRRLTPRSGDLLFAREAPVGPVVRIPDTENVAPGQRTVLMRPDPRKVDSRFLYYLLSSRPVQGRLQDLAAGSTVAHLNVADVRSFALDVPDLPTQTAIADVLGALDDKIAANERVVQLSEGLVRTKFLALLSASNGTALVSDYLRLHYGKGLPADQRRPGDYPVVGSGGPNGTHQVRLCEAPGVVVGRKGSVGTVWWMDSGFWPIDTAFYAEPASGVGMRFVFELLRWLNLGELNSDSAVPGLNRDAALAQPVPLVAMEDVAEFDRSVASALLFQARVRRESDLLRTTRDALLPELMSGRLGVLQSSR